MEKPIQAPSRGHYGIGCAVVIVGIVLFVVFLLTQISGGLPQIQVVVPGTHEIYLAKPGRYTVFYEYRSVVDNEIYATGESMSGMSAMLKSKDDSREVTLSKPSGSSTYEAGGRAGVSVLEFEIEEPGTYIFAADYRSGVSGPEVVFAIGQFKILGTVLGGLGIFFGSLFIGGGIIVRTFLKRRETLAIQKPLTREEKEAALD